MERAHSTAEVVEMIGAPSERWLVEQIRSGRFPGRKVARSWRMTDSDVTAALDAWRNDGAHVKAVPSPTGLTPCSRRRVAGQNGPTTVVPGAPGSSAESGG